MECSADLVHHQGGQRFAFDILGDDEQRPPHLRDLLQDRKQVLHAADLLLVDQDKAVLQLHFHLLRIRYKIRGEVAAVELHSLDDLQFGLQTLGLFHGDDAFLAHLLHRFGDDCADRLIVVGGNGADLGDFLRILGRFALFLEFLHNHFDGLVHTALQIHRIASGRNAFCPFAENRLGQDRCGGRSIAGDVAGLAGHFPHHLGAHVFELVFKLDFLRNGYAVLRDVRRAIAPVNDHVSSLRPERDLDCIGQGIHPFENRLPCFFVILKYLRSHVSVLLIMINN